MDVFLTQGEIDPQDTQYGYIPTKNVCVLFIVLYAFACVTHVGQAVYYRLWFLFPTIILGGLVEVVGWSGRYWSSRNVLLSDPFMMQITATILAPTFILAADFIIFGRIIHQLGSVYSRLRPRTYATLFLSCDIISLVVQGIGGGMASSAATLKGANNGAHVMLGGIVFQLVIIVVYATLFTEFFYRYYYDKPFPGRFEADDASDASIYRGDFVPKLKALACGLIFSTLCLFIRAIYRTVELADGWLGRVIRTEIYFNVLDGAMVVLAMYTIIVVHPGYFLRTTNISGKH